ncbi:MAG: hypothetical protein Q8M19_00200 [Reyranella sp.]|nr:hypothetical protein [Reyranella sp.]
MNVKDRLGPLPIFHAMETRRWRDICQAAFEENSALPKAAMSRTVTGKGRVTIPNRFTRLRRHAGKSLSTAEITS